MLKPSFCHSLFARNFHRSSSVTPAVTIVALVALGIAFAPAAEAKGRPNAPAPAPAPNAPGPRTWHAMSGDGSQSENGIYLYGGTTMAEDGTSILLSDFWFYDLRNFAWQAVKTNGRTKPGGKVHASFSCGPTECVLAQGWPSNRKGSGTDTWIFNKATSSWSELNCTTALCPGPRRIAAFTFDAYRGVHLLFGGEGRRTMDFLGDTYTFEQGAWIRHVPTDAPSPRFAAAVAFVPGLDMVVLSGGQINYGESPNACDMWAWNGNNWQEITQSGGPCLAAHSMAWDTSTTPPRLLVIGGYKRWNHMERNPDVWTFTFSANGKSGSWTMHSPQSLACSYTAPYVGEGEPFYPGSKMAADGKKVFFGGEENLENGAVDYAGLIVCD